MSEKRIVYRGFLGDESSIGLEIFSDGTGFVVTLDLGQDSTLFPGGGPTVMMKREAIHSLGCWLIDQSCSNVFAPTVAQEDPWLIDWLMGIRNGKPCPSGDFLRTISESALRADPENYRLLRTTLLVLKEKYPDYCDPEGR